MGNTCVLKPAPLNATRIARLVDEHTDVPARVVNVVTSSDHLTGEVLTTSPEVDMVAFTGSSATGRRIPMAGSASLKRVFLELGGTSVNLVLDDADLAVGLGGAVMCCLHTGQGCALPTRLLPRPGHRTSRSAWPPSTRPSPPTTSTTGRRRWPTSPARGRPSIPSTSSTGTRR